MALSAPNTCVLGCNSGTRPLAPSGVGSQYLQCEECGLAFVRNLSAASNLESQYLKDSTSPVSYYQATASADRVTFRRRLRLMATFQSQRGRLLDVGCSIGTLMSVAKELGWEVEGLEPNPKAANLAREQGFSMREGFFTAEQVRELPGGYQCVVMSDVIEHISDPVEALRLAKGLLEPGGFLLVSTPNLESFWCRKFQLKPEEHLFLFSSENLRTVLERQGLKIYHLQETSRRRDLRELNHSTTELGRGAKIMLAGLCRLRLDGVSAWLMDRLFRDELLVIARKSRRAEP
ncbi:MAG: class I SAM-dependent methyltransferase [Syntrophobacterales bacterium]